VKDVVWERTNETSPRILFHSVSRFPGCEVGDGGVEVGRPCEAPCRAVSMPRHACHGHATPHQQKFERERKNRSKGQRAIHIHSFILHTQARVSFLQREGVYDVTSALCFAETLDPLCSSRTVSRVSTRRDDTPNDHGIGAIW